MPNCNCKCPRIIKSIAVLDLGTILAIVIPPTTFRVREEFKLVICQTIPVTDPGVDAQVVVTDGTTVYLTFDKLSEFVRRSNVVCRRCYNAIAGNDPVHIQLCGIADRCHAPNELVTAATPVDLTTITAETIIAAIEAALTPITPTGGAV